MKDEIFLYLRKHGRLPFDQKFQNFRNGDKWYGNFQEKFFENLGIPHEVVLFNGIYANSQSSTQRELVLLAAITASCTSQARMTRIQ